MHSKLRTMNGWGGERAYWCFREKFYARAVFPRGEGSAWVLFSAGENLYWYTFSGGSDFILGRFFRGEVLCGGGGGNSMLQQRHRYAGGLKKKLYLRSGSQRHRNIIGFFNVPVLHRHGPPFLYGYSEKPPHLVAFSGIRRTYSTDVLLNIYWEFDYQIQIYRWWKFVKISRGIVKYKC